MECGNEGVAFHSYFPVVQFLFVTISRWSFLYLVRFVSVLVCIGVSCIQFCPSVLSLVLEFPVFSFVHLCSHLYWSFLYSDLPICVLTCIGVSCIQFCPSVFSLVLEFPVFSFVHRCCRLYCGPFVPGFWKHIRKK